LTILQQSPWTPRILCDLCG